MGSCLWTETCQINCEDCNRFQRFSRWVGRVECITNRFSCLYFWAYSRITTVKIVNWLIASKPSRTVCQFRVVILIQSCRQDPHILVHWRATTARSVLLVIQGAKAYRTFRSCGYDASRIMFNDLRKFIFHRSQCWLRLATLALRLCTASRIHSIVVFAGSQWMLFRCGYIL